VAARPHPRPRVRSHGHAKPEGHRLRRLRALGRRWEAPSGGRGQEDHGRSQGGATAGEALRRLSGGHARPASDYFLHQRLPDLAVGRSGLSASRGGGFLQEGRAGFADSPPRAPGAARCRPSEGRDRRSLLPEAGHREHQRAVRPGTAQGPPGDGHRQWQDPHHDCAGGSPAAGRVGETGALPGRPGSTRRWGPSRPTCRSRAR